MTISELRGVYQAQPFRAFNIHLADGKVISVKHPEFLSHSPSGRTVIVYHTNDEAFDVIDLLLVTRLEVLNGQRQKSPRARKGRK